MQACKIRRAYRIVFFVLVTGILLTLFSTIMVHAASGKYTPITGVEVQVKDASDTSYKNNIVTVTVKGSGGLWGIGAYSSTSTITVYNNSGTKATISFDWTASSVNELKIDGSVKGGTYGSFEKLLDAGASFTITITTAENSTKNTFKMTNFSVQEAKASSTVVFDYNEEFGDVTIDGTSCSAGSSMEVPVSGAQIVATPNTGYSFLGWIDGNNKIISLNASHMLTPTADITVKAIFAKDGGTPWFAIAVASQTFEETTEAGDGGLGDLVGGIIGGATSDPLMYYQTELRYMYYGWDAAMAAANGEAKTVILMNNAVLPAGTYSVPSGVTLLIPFDSANTLYTTQAHAITSTEEAGKKEYTTPTSYRTLTMAEGANLVINGEMSVSAKHCRANGGCYYGGSPTGPVGFVRMQNNSSITLNNGGKLYVHGFITGSGSVTVNNGGTVYEMFQIEDFRGGTQSTQMQNGVFPFCQYYIQNIEVPLTIYAGATERAMTTIFMSNTAYHTDVSFVGSSAALFNLKTNGRIIKWYDGSKDKTFIEVYGETELSNITIKIGTGSVASQEFELPLSNFNITLKSDAKVTVKQDCAMLPGSTVVIEKNATMTFNSGVSVYVYDQDQWGSFAYAGGNKTFRPVTYAPGRTYTRTEADLIDAQIIVNGTLDAHEGYLYTTASGANICGGEGGIIIIKAGTQAVTHQLVQGVGYTEIPITPAKLKNADGSYFDKTAKATEAHAFVYKAGVWGCEKHAKEGNVCTVCDYVELCEQHTEVVDAAVAATCTENGLTEGKHCSVCNEVLTAQEVIPATGHTEVVDAAKAATCTETGITEGKHCSVCSAVLVAQEEIPALGHTEQIVAGKAATCTETGLTEGKKCTVCGETTVAQQEIPAKGHTEETVAGKDATCTATGLTDGKKCSVCGEVLTAQEEIPAKGHTEEAVAGKDATCTESGLKDGVKCSVCGITLTAQEVILATGHSFDEWKVITEASESKAGEKRSDCKNCDFYRTDTIPVLSHDCSRWPTETLEAKAPTCTETGLTEGSECSGCGSDIVAQEVIPALGHKEETLTGKAATCTVSGLTEGKKCTVCGETTVAQEEISALGHTEQILPGKAATCTETGLTDGKKCTVCGETTVAQEEISAKGHTKETITGKAATCTVAGLTDGEKCSVCGVILTAQEEIPAKGHTEETIASKDATCTESGLKDGVKCSVCGVTITAQEVIPAKGHTEETVAGKDATCTATGLTVGKKCTVCGETTVAQEEIPAKGHTEVIDAAVDATCTEAGKTEGKHCSVCGEVLVAQEEINALGHTAVIDEAVAVTCTVPGKTEGKHCSVCNVVLVAQEVIPNPGHDYKTEVTAPTCTEDGYTTYTCSVCSDTYTADKVSAVGHAYNGVVTKEPVCTEGEMTYTCGNCGDSYPEAIDAEHNEFEGSCKDCGAQLCAHDSEPEEIPAVEASCLVPGKTAGEKCPDCGKVTKKPEIVPAAGHSYSSEVTKDVTCTENGIQTFTCEKCDHSYTEDIAAPGHNIVTDAAVEPTCSSVGLTQGSHCDYCGEVFVAQGIIPKLKHTDKDPSPDHICDICEITIGIHKAYSGTHDCAYCGKPASECVDSDADSLCDVCGKNVAVAITFVDYYGSTTKYYGVGENIAFPEPLTESYSFELEFLGWNDGSGNVVTEAIATTDATYTAAYKIIGFKTESLQLSVEYGAKNAADEAQGIIMYATLFVYTDATGMFTTPTVMRGDNTVEAIFTFTGMNQNIYMYRFAFTAEDIAENETYISIGIGNCVRQINQVLFKYAESLSGIVGDGESTEAVMTAQQKLIESMIRYGGAVQDCFEEDHSDVETNGMLEATSAILSGFDKLDAERFFRDDNNSAINTHFEAATGVFGTMISLEYYYTVTLNVQNPTNVSVGVIVADSKAELENLSGAFNSETTSTAKLYASETIEYDGKDYYVSTTDGMTINEMEDKYAVIYVTYTVDTETYHHYGDIVEYGIERFAQRQIKDYSPKSVGGDEKTVSADKSYNTAQYVNMLLRILNAHEAAKTLEALRAPRN